MLRGGKEISLVDNMDYQRLVDEGRECASRLGRRQVNAARHLAFLVADQSAWCVRRTDAIELAGHDLIRRKISLEILMPDSNTGIDADWVRGIVSGPASDVKQTVVPLIRVQKASLMGFSLHDSSGDELPYLLSGENGALSALLLVGMCQLDNDTSNDVFESLFEDALAISCAEPDSETATAAISAFVKKAEEAGSSNAAAVKYFAEVLRSAFILYAILPQEGPARRIVRFEYVDAMTGESSRWAVFRGALANPGRADYSISLPAIGDVRSFHADLSVPASVEVTYAEVEEDGRLGGPDPHGWSGATVRQAHTAHVHLTAVPRDARASLTFVMTLQRVTGAPLAAAFAVAILFGSNLMVAFSTPASLASNNALWVPILLVVPTSFALFLGDGAEPHVLTRILRLFRIVGFLATTYLVLLALAIVYLGDQQVRYVASSGVAASIVMGWPLAKWYFTRHS